MTPIGAVAIGRNEGDRLRHCLESLAGRCAAVVYVDSGSIDGSIALARSLGAEVVELDPSIPFTAARARNAGYARLREVAPGVPLVQFVDGDCEVVAGWLDRASAEMAAHPGAAVVCGRVRERNPGRSLYNRLADIEWDTPIGEVTACGGIALMRSDAFSRAGGFDPTLIAGEEPELCHRLRQAGGTILRVDAEMALHDLDMTRFGQWWRRQVRSGYGTLDVASRHAGGPFARQILSSRVWTVGWMSALAAATALAVLAGAPAPALLVVAAVALLPSLQAMRISWRKRAKLPNALDTIALGLLTMIGKWGEILGQARFLRDRALGRSSRIIEYKAGTPARVKRPA